jgi:hypothetical protein
MAHTAQEMLVGMVTWLGAAVAAGIVARVLIGRVLR